MEGVITCARTPSVATNARAKVDSNLKETDTAVVVSVHRTKSVQYL